MNSADFFETPPFLEQKLGLEIFNDIPQAPGIYRFYDENEILLYVGKAKNLRRRLFTYKCAKPGKTSRKEAALISKIHRFEYDILESEEEAILQENHWIREHRPEFNHANKHTETYYFITIQENQSGLLFGLSMNPLGNLFPDSDKPLYRNMHPPFEKGVSKNVYGCFKGHRTVRTSLGLILQLLWMAEYQSPSPHFLPIQLSRNLTPMRFQIPVSEKSTHKREELINMLDDWFLGISPGIIEYLREKIRIADESHFTRKFIDESIEILSVFYQRNLERYRMMRELTPGRESHLIHQHELDDLITKLNGK